MPGCPRVVDPDRWLGLRNLIHIRPECIGPRRRRPRFVCNYILNRLADLVSLPDLVRGHWGVENIQHRAMDVQIREDDCRLHKGNALVVMSSLP